MTLAELAVLCRETGGPGWGKAADNLKRACELLIRYATESQPAFAAEVDALIGDMSVFAPPAEPPKPIPVEGLPRLEWNPAACEDSPVLTGTAIASWEIVAQVIAGRTWEEIGRHFVICDEAIRQCLLYHVRVATDSRNAEAPAL